MGKYKITHNRPECIGCSACVGVAPDFWEMDEDGKSNLKGSQRRDDGWEEMGIADETFNLNKEAADSCPVNVIHIKNTETNEDII